jgi:mannosylglycerate hydrolase MGH1-like protein
MRGRRYHALLALFLLAGAARAEPQFKTGDPAIDALQPLLVPALDANRKAFVGATGRIEGFGAGAAYPQLWLRDSATLVPLARWQYPREVLASWIEEHLAHQQPDGSLFDWIAPAPAAGFREWAPRARDVFTAGAAVISADKNTTEADQETSAIDAAWQVWRLTGDGAWLRKEIRGRRLLDRLDVAALFLWQQRLDRATGLVVNALTADWGDVGPVYADQRAIYVDPATPLALGLYTNALAVRAARQLAEMAAAAGDPVRASFWRTRSVTLRAAAFRRFWQEQRGYFCMHVAQPPRPGGGTYAWPLPEALQDDGARFALGGNAMAVLAGLANAEQAGRIIAAAEASRKEARLFTLGAVLLPPFPKGAFPHPAMREPWSYQNGGQWDWFAGRFVLAEFEAGHSLLAREHLAGIARRAQAAGGLYEWYTRNGVGRGSRRYAGSAAALGQALIEGLFGVDLHAGRLDLRVRLDRSGFLLLHEPATNRSVELRYRVESRRLDLDLDTNATVGPMAVLLPSGTRVAEARVGDASSAFTTETLGEDIYAVVGGGSSPIRVELRLER